MAEKFHCEQESERDHVFEACFAKSLMELVKKSKAYPEIQRRNAELESQLNASLAERDILQSQLADLQGRVASIRQQLETIVCTEGIDAGIIFLSHDGPCHYDPEQKCQVYDHEYFSPLGDALIALHRLTAPAENVGKGTD